MNSKVLSQDIYRTISQNIETYHREITYNYDLELVELEVPVNHIHIVVKSPPLKRYRLIR
ncbi:transposase [Agarilytica rhodophyticola]|uniref:transposase n=1 Tax=Agarilytica rhodophyticola TaxID=1737490 RepID=UPI003CCB8067